MVVLYPRRQLIVFNVACWKPGGPHIVVGTCLCLAESQGQGEFSWIYTLECFEDWRCLLSLKENVYPQELSSTLTLILARYSYFDDLSSIIDCGKNSLSSLLPPTRHNMDTGPAKLDATSTIAVCNLLIIVSSLDTKLDHYRVQLSLSNDTTL